MTHFDLCLPETVFADNCERQTYQQGRYAFQSQDCCRSYAGIFGQTCGDRLTDLFSFGYFDALREEMSETFIRSTIGQG